MITTALVISSETPFDAERVTTALRTAPTEIWKRKQGLKVHGPHTIPAMSWVFEQTDKESGIEQSILALFDHVPGLDGDLRALTSDMNLKASIVCRVCSKESMQEMDLASTTLKRLSSSSLRLICSVEFQSD